MKPWSNQIAITYTTVRSVVIQTDDVELIPFYTKWTTKGGRGGKALVTCQGRPPKCLKCFLSGHKRKDCTTEQCSKCKGWGHNDPECKLPLNWGKTTSQNEDNMDVESEINAQDDEATTGAVVPISHAPLVIGNKPSSSSRESASEPVIEVQLADSAQTATHTPRQGQSGTLVDAHAPINDDAINSVDPVKEPDQPWLSSRKRRKRRSKGKRGQEGTQTDESDYDKKPSDKANTVGNSLTIKTAARAFAEAKESELSSITAAGVEANATPNITDDINVITNSYTSARAGKMEAVNCSITKSCFDSTLDEEEETGEASDVTVTNFSSDSAASHISSFLSQTSTPIQTRRSRHRTRSSDKDGERDRSQSASRSRSPSINNEMKSSRKQINKK